MPLALALVGAVAVVLEGADGAAGLKPSDLNTSVIALSLSPTDTSIARAAPVVALTMSGLMTFDVGENANS